ncbi:STAS/SEC14 domain-containing protein [Methyloligella sp. 2.7D]|uniref:STAS/SEC14 domain-containing protein n=1 Tax=unclassified Methyloligella TaxID=2625955 RepID=UPI00157D494A|nr:STAS/SEC14 domain-containing protein [Methyloligella sp. GL2]QKP76022.1 STAS/SEC14 domain-containing protein [Methyloligella sp. GL2]
MIELLEGFPDDVVAIAFTGEITRKDYEMVLIPAVEKALKTHDKISIYYEIRTDFAGVDPTAAWEDFKLGMEHLSRWRRIAVVTDVEWIANSVRFFAIMMPAEMKAFPLADAPQAREWIGRK